MARRKPAESRRWLKPRVPEERLHMLAPARAKPKPLVARNLWDRARYVIRAWWVWMVAALIFFLAGSWYAAVLAGALSFVFYHTCPTPHPALYALDPGFDTDSAEFRATMAGVTGMPLVEGNRVDVYNNGDEFYPAMLEA